MKILIIPFIIFLIITVDILGYGYKCRVSENFRKYHLRMIPFIWLIYSN